MKLKFKKLRIGTIYMIVSAIFLSSCVVYYGARFIYYYNLSQGKLAKRTTNLNEILTDPIKLVVQGDGLQVDGNRYVFRGKEVDNYLSYSGFLWRIMEIDDRGNIKLITDETITVMPWNSTENDYETSLIRQYLNPIEGVEGSGTFYQLLDEPEKYLVPNELCADKTMQPTEVLGCKVHVSDYVGLMNVNEYFFANGVDSYLNTQTRHWTLTAKSDDNRVYYVFSEGGVGDNSESATDKYSYGVRPVITLKANLDITGGAGLKDNPYRITEDALDMEEVYALNSLPVGTYFQYENQTWRTIGFEDGKTKAIMMDVIRNEDETPLMYRFAKNTAKFNLKSGSLGAYLNTTWYNTFEHPEYLTEGTFYTGAFNSQTGYAMDKIKAATVKAKIGLPQINDLYTTNTLEATEYDPELIYWTCNYKDSFEWLTWTVRNGDWLFADFATEKYAVRPVIYLKDSIIITTGDGTYDTPYEIMEVTE
ncbi:MAG: hypothetical protein PUF50_05970 [Erysipelotrichaceae bacterium]|nr:hypothetical protein [Erysipelotrichaceae bacterium]